MVKKVDSLKGSMFNVLGYKSPEERQVESQAPRIKSKKQFKELLLHTKRNRPILIKFYLSSEYSILKSCKEISRGVYRGKIGDTEFILDGWNAPETFYILKKISGKTEYHLKYNKENFKEYYKKLFVEDVSVEDEDDDEYIKKNAKEYHGLYIFKLQGKIVAYNDERGKLYDFYKSKRLFKNVNLSELPNFEVE